MKVIFLKDVPGTGNRGDIKEVSDGYAQNFLIPGRKAEAATASAMSRLEGMKERIEAERKKSLEAVAGLLDSIDGKSITLKEQVNEAGGLFSKIGAGRIAEEIKTQLEVEIPEDIIQLHDPIKEAGEREVTISADDKKVSLKVNIEQV